MHLRAYGAALQFEPNAAFSATACTQHGDWDDCADGIGLGSRAERSNRLVLADDR